MRLDEVIAPLFAAELRGDGALDVLDVHHDSRQVVAGSLFGCLRGSRTDGHDHAPQAVAAGAVAVLVDRWLDLGVAEVLVPDTRAAIGPVAAEVHRRPSTALDVVGVTGTNGKTTVTWLLARILEAAGRRTEISGTLTGERTTPEAPDLQRRLAAWRDQGVAAVAMEVSSHALDQHRVDGTRFRVAVFTNLSRDHLDYHGSMEAYFEAKARLFTPALADAAVVNLDSPHGRLLRDAALVPTTGYSLDDIDDLWLGPTESRFRWRGRDVRLGLAGRFNVANALAAATTATTLGVDEEAVVAGLSGPVLVPGRLEPVDAGQDFTVLVDYAHTPDGLAEVLRAASEVVAPGAAVRVVFGCGGDRDATKRPLMGEVAARNADAVVLTSDNSRSEDTDAIIAAVQAGFDEVVAPRARSLVVDPDRRAAITAALADAQAGDVVVIAGKGHETTQAEGGRTVAFDDRLVARQALEALGAGRSGS